MNCQNSSHYCVAALQQKQNKNSIEGNLRNQLAKIIKLNYEVTYVWNRPNDYISTAKKNLYENVEFFTLKFGILSGFRFILSSDGINDK